MPNNSYKKYWKSLEQRDAGGELNSHPGNEFPGLKETLSKSPKPTAIKSIVNRRSFLKLSGFTFAATLATGCKRATVEKAIPYLVQPDEATPGRAYWYASMCAGCTAGCGVLAKNRDGRPIKLEGNPDHPLSKGGLCVIGQAAILGLYDSKRLKQPMAQGKETSWQQVDQSIKGKLAEIKESGKQIRFLTHTLTSPSTLETIDQFLGQFDNAKHIICDPLSSSAILDAHEKTHGQRVLPRYRFDRADMIVGLNADFLGTWISPVEFTAGYQARRDLSANPGQMSDHIQFESRMSLTGSNADQRLVIGPDETGLVASHIAKILAQRNNVEYDFGTIKPCSIDQSHLTQIADKLVLTKGRNLVVCGVNDTQTQVMVNLINHLLGNYGHTIDINEPSYQYQGNDSDFIELIAEIKAGKVGALFVDRANPIYDLPDGKTLAEEFKKIPLLVSFADQINETSNLAQTICPDHHFLESWNDAESIAGVLTVTQPTIQKLGNTRSLRETLSVWMGNARADYDLIQDYWKKNIFTRQKSQKSFQGFWDKAVHDGFAVVSSSSASGKSFDMQAVEPVVSLTPQGNDKYFIELYPKVSMSDGRYAQNPWLHELPDPISKIVWDNYASLSPATAKKLNIKQGDVLKISVKSTDAGDKMLTLPALVQPGQHDALIAVALGYGRMGTERFENIGPKWIQGKPTLEKGELVGKNGAVFLALNDKNISYIASKAIVAKTGKCVELACSQSYHSLDVPEHLASPQNIHRPAVQETTHPEFVKDPNSGQHHQHGGDHSLWAPDHQYKGYHWGMAIDLTACTGCSACVVSCQVENNIPVVGKDEVRRHREMHWLRIDRYYSDNKDGVDVIHQPMMCHHCDNAPCETVCPVLATVHSSEGLNQQIYNRCVGTRYCANNCPYKTRRFNWFNYSREDKLQNMVLNPDITIRTRGVMEKCSFCVQRIQEAKSEAKRKNSPLTDGDILPACQQSCPANAIVFGDMNDPQSAVAKLKKNLRHYLVLAELKVEPSVGYLTRVRNRLDNGDSVHG